ncbi:MAG: hypothetical protein WBB29_06575 [Geitlerinemataceae cyanobacterium]
MGLVGVAKRLLRLKLLFLETEVIEGETLQTLLDRAQATETAEVAV